MEANELRIGNLIYFYKDPKDKEVSIGKIKSIYYSPTVYQSYVVELYDGFVLHIKKEIKPIKLTEKLFLKIRFNKIGVNFQINGISIWHSSYSKCYQLRYCLIGSEIERKINLEFLHQLQNLYFSLTGEELNVNI